MAGQSQRIQSLDVLRGVAVMGILAMNIVSFALPPVVYFNPTAYGMSSTADMASWIFSFIFVDGKMRGLFSFLFGASLAIVADSAAKNGQRPIVVVGARQFWLLVIGLIHCYLIWYGDILTQYAVIGMVAYWFRNMDGPELLAAGAALLLTQILAVTATSLILFDMAQQAAAPGALPEVVAAWHQAVRGFSNPGPDAIAQSVAVYSGPYSGILHETLTAKGNSPLLFMVAYGLETLAYMLFGMAALKSGLLTGQWDGTRYRRWAALGLAITLPVMACLAWALVRADFQPQHIFLYSITLTTPFRPLMIVAYAAMVVLLSQRGGWLVERIGAAGRAAFTNYLGTSILMTFVFYGWGLGWFGSLDRAELWWPVIGTWVLMLTWSKPWLDRFRYGPLEWVWRSLARGSFQSMR